MIKKLKAKIPKNIAEFGTEIAKRGNAMTASITSFFAQGDLLKWTEELTKGAATIYDKALDRDYLNGLSGGGGNHRIFDGGHDIFNAWERAKEAAADDTFSQEVMGYISALWKDVTTTKGLPFATLEKASYEEWTEKVAGWIPGMNKEYLADLVSFDAMEVVGSALGAVGLMFALSKEDMKKVSEILGSMGVVSIASANPIMGVCVVAIGVYAYFVKKKEFDKGAIAKSASLAVVSGVIFTVLGMPVLIELAVVLVVTTLLKKHLFNNKEAMAILKQRFSETGTQGATLLLKLTEELNNQLKKAAKNKAA